MSDDRKPLDSVKGLLIITVVLGHSILAESLIPGLKAAVYSFHVQCFLLIPFLFPAPALTGRNLVNTLTRYIVPYVLTVVAFSALHAMARDASIITRILDLLRALLTGNANDLKQATGFYFFWFLPVLSVTVVLRSVYFNCRPKLLFLLAAFAIVGHFLLPAMPWSLKQKWPLFGTHIAMFIFPLGLCVHYATRPVVLRIVRRMRLVWGLAFSVSLWLLVQREAGANLGNLGYASYRNLPVLLVQDAVAIFAFLSLFTLSDILAQIPFLSGFGKRSLAIYLWHQPLVAGVPRSVLFPRSVCDFLCGLGLQERSGARAIGV